MDEKFEDLWSGTIVEVCQGSIRARKSAFIRWLEDRHRDEQDRVTLDFKQLFGIDYAWYIIRQGQTIITMQSDTEHSMNVTIYISPSEQFNELLRDYSAKLLADATEHFDHPRPELLDLQRLDAVEIIKKLSGPTKRDWHSDGEVKQILESNNHPGFTTDNIRKIRSKTLKIRKQDLPD